MGYKLLCNEKIYPTLYFYGRKEARIWLFNHAKIQLDCQKDLREPKDVGHDINLKKVDTYQLANYFDFTLTRH